MQADSEALLGMIGKEHWASPTSWPITPELDARVTTLFRAPGSVVCALEHPPQTVGAVPGAQIWVYPYQRVPVRANE